MKRIFALLLIAAAALLWSTDNLVRYPASVVLDPTVVVFAEHIVGLLVIAVWVIVRHRKELMDLNLREWLAVAIIGAGGSALGGIFYTIAIHSLGLSIPILIQKLQPILVVILAYFFLGERVKVNLFPWGIVALLSAVLLSFPDLKFDFLSKEVIQREKSVLYAVGAMVMWAFSTVAGKYLLRRQAPAVAIFWRWVAASVTLGVLLLASGTHVPFKQLTTGRTFRSVLYLGTIAGVLPMWIYYHGLKHIPASVATFVELLYPLVGIILSVIVLNANLTFIQINAGVILLLAVLLITIPKKNAQEPGSGSD